jgi:predicted GH43/DUF377 family glycosyl hydrolase
MINLNKHGILLKKTNNSFECDGVLNPAVIKSTDGIHLFYRAVTKDNYSTIGYCKLSSPLVIEHRNEEPLLVPQHAYEFQGLEDPRIVKIEHIYYLTYTAYDGVNALGALATSTDLVNWTKHGIVVPQITFEEFAHFSRMHGLRSDKYARYNSNPNKYDNHSRTVFVWDKNLTLFPRKINGKFCILHRIKPDIQIVVGVNDLAELTVEFWQNYLTNFIDYIVLSPKYDHEVSYVGSGCPPIETVSGWLIIYHGVRDTINGYVYSACAALFETDQPHKEIARLPYPLFFPEKEWEIHGEVNNVCFPTGALIENDILYIYYGAADEQIAVASLSLTELLTELELNKI